MAGHPAEHAQQDATLRTMALGTLILNAFSVRAAPGRFIRCRRSAIQNDMQTNTYDPRRPGATSSLLSCRQGCTTSQSALADFICCIGGGYAILAPARSSPLSAPKAQDSG